MAPRSNAAKKHADSNAESSATNTRTSRAAKAAAPSNSSTTKRAASPNPDSKPAKRQRAAAAEEHTTTAATKRRSQDDEVIAQTVRLQRTTKADVTKAKAAPKKTITKATSTTKQASTTKAVTKSTSTTKKADTKTDTAAKKITKAATKPAAKAKVSAAKKSPVEARKVEPEINSTPTEILRVFACGEGSAGELGLGPKGMEVKRPRYNALLDPETTGVVQMSAGGMHVIALTHDNRILTWGVNDQGALGRDTSWEGGLRDADEESDSGDEDLNPRESTPTAVDASHFPIGTKFVEVAAGDSCSFALTTTGHVYGWGTFRVGLIDETDDNIRH
jgi:regulator of chromosome condensation